MPAGIGRWRPALRPLAVRLVVLAAGTVLAVVPAVLTPMGVVAVLAGAVVAAALPRTFGSIPVTAVFVLVWVVSPGWDGAPSVARTAVAASALYVLHSATALAACLPLGCAVGTGVLRVWTVRALGPAVLAAAVGAVSAVLPQQRGSALPELLGLVGVVLVGAAVTWAMLRSDSVDRAVRVPDTMNGRNDVVTTGHENP